MKKHLLTFLQICLLSSAVMTVVHANDCTYTNLRLNSQALVNAFDPSCTSIKGNITISGADITDLTPLANIETIDGILTIQSNTSLATLKGLEKLASAKSLLIYSNTLLTDLSGLEGLISVPSTLHIRYNSILTSLKGLDNLTNANSIYISNNDLLPNLSGLGSLESVADLLSISSNKKLISLNGLTSLTSVARILIGENELLPDLSGLESLRSVSWQMNISSNKSMLNFNGLDNLTSLSELYISDNNLMTDLSGLEVLGGLYWLVVGESKGLTSLNGLNNLLSVTNFIIRGNDLLTDLSGLESVTNIGWIQISGNPKLKSLSGLGETGSGLRFGSNLRVAALTIGGLSITNNPNLTTCAIAPVCEFVSDNIATISGNGTGCESQSAVEVACGSLPVTLTHFTATAENKTAVLQWATTEERNSSVFEIEHSLDAKKWQKTGAQPAKGESNTLINYHWVHTTPASDLNYYRLKMIDLDGTFTYSRIADVQFEGLPIFIYPNPVSDILFVENKDDVVRLRIVDLQGKTVHETKNVSREGFSVKKLAKGLYEVQVTRQNGAVQAQRIAVL